MSFRYGYGLVFLYDDANEESTCVWKLSVCYLAERMFYFSCKDIIFSFIALENFYKMYLFKMWLQGFVRMMIKKFRKC